MNLSDNLKEIYRENGNLVSLTDSTFRVIGEEYIQLDDPPLSNAGSEQALFSHCIRRGSVANDTEIGIGALLSFDGNNWLVVDRNAMLLADELCEYSVLLFQINIKGKITRLSEQRDTVSYQNVITETVIAESAYGFMDIPTMSYQQTGIGITVKKDALLYLPDTFGAKPGDRFMKSDTEKYQILMTKTNIIPGIITATITDDFRYANV